MVKAVSYHINGMSNPAQKTQSAFQKGFEMETNRCLHTPSAVREQREALLPAVGGEAPINMYIKRVSA